MYHKNCYLLQPQIIVYVRPDKMPKYSDIDYCFYDPINHRVLELLHPGTFKGINSGLSLDELQLKNPNAEYWNFDRACIDFYNSFKTAPNAISEAEFNRAIETIVKINWVACSASESFKCADCLAGSITQIYARLGDKYYTLIDDIFLSHNDIIKRVNRENNK